MLDMIPDSVMPHVVQYLTFDDVMQIPGKIFPDDIILKYMKFTDVDEPIRYIFKDFKSVDDPGRLQTLEGLMKNVDFDSKLSFWGSVLNLCLSKWGGRYYGDYHGFSKWLETPDEESPAKKYLRSKLGNEAELQKLLARGQWQRENLRDKYEPTLPPGMIDVFSQLITKGDQESVLLFDQLLSNWLLKNFFKGDVKCGVFADSMAEIRQPNVLLKDEVSGQLGAVGPLIRPAVSLDRFDILDGILRKFKLVEFRYVFDTTFWEILRKGRSVPGYDYQLLKDLLPNHMDSIINIPFFGDHELDRFYCQGIKTGTKYVDYLVVSLMQEDPTPQLESLYSFMMEQFQSNGIQIDPEQVCREAIAYEIEVQSYKF